MRSQKISRLFVRPKEALSARIENDLSYQHVFRIDDIILITL